MRSGTIMAAAMLAAVAGAPAALAQDGPPPAVNSQDAGWHNRQMLYLLTLSPADGWRATPSGLRYRRIKAGPAGAPHPAPTDRVTIHYAGRLIDGTEFDSSIARGAPATFPLPRLIRGWQEGVPLMAVGDTFEFAIPQALAYGPDAKGPIPGGATLVFTIELFATAPAGG
ncbi:MAG: FKBP-type peptidyl-prolyl cis-trans isomerase [Pseudomonadota bacterium]